MSGIACYTHRPPTPVQEPDSRPGDYYVSVVDPSSNAGHGRVALLLGPFRTDHTAALAQVGAARGYVEEHYPGAHWWAFGTVRLPAAHDNPAGKLNELLGPAPSPTAEGGQ